VQAGLIEDREPGIDVPAAIRADVTISGRQRQVLIDIYELFRKDSLAGSRAAQPTQSAESPTGRAVPSANGRPYRREG
jgi:hypothetical protein